MKEKTITEVFSAGCPLCRDSVKEAKEKYADSSEVRVLDMHDVDVAERARKIGITAVPSIVVDGKIADCCSGRGKKTASMPAMKTAEKSCCCG